jgi:type I restriction enzyme S subunit
VSVEDVKSVFEPEKPDVPDDWSVAPFSDVVEVVSDKGKRTKQREYLAAGHIPVIDQGQDFIGGYIDNEEMAFDGDLPIIVFGDHTRSVKYVTQRFAVGADGVKLLKPTECFEPKFFFYLLKSLQIPSRGYSRHFQFLKKFHLPIAPLEQQKRIVAEIEKQFSRLDEAVANLKRVKANLKRYKAAVLNAAVEGKLTEEWRKQHPDVEPAEEFLKRANPSFNALEIDGAPLSTQPSNWCAVTLEKLTQYITSGSRGWAKYYSETGDLFIRAQNIKTDRLELDDVAYVQLPDKAEGQRTLVQIYDLLVTITGANVTKAALVDHEIGKSAYVNQHVALARPVDKRLAAFLYLWVVCPAYGRRDLEKAAYGAGKPGLNLKNLKGLKIAVPPIDEQQEIIQEVEKYLSLSDAVDRTLTKNLKRAERLRQSILKNAFSGNLI